MDLQRTTVGQTCEGVMGGVPGRLSSRRRPIPCAGPVSSTIFGAARFAKRTILSE